MVVLAVLGFLAGALPAGAVSSSPGASAGEAVPGELLVGFSPSLKSLGRAAVHQRHGATLLKHFGEIGVDLVRVPRGLSMTEVRNSYAAETSVRFAEPNYLRRAAGVTPNDPEFGNQWGLRNTGQTVAGDPGTADADTDASEPAASQDAWQVNTGSSSTVVAVIDTGIQIAHPDLAANVWTNPGEIPNGIDDDGNGYIDDLNGWDFAHDDKSVYDPSESCGGQVNDGHGTHVAGILGAVGNNGAGIAGVNWTTRIIPLKFLAKVGSVCGVGEDSDAIGAILYAAKMGAQFINASWGGAPASEALRQAFIVAGRAGIVFAAAAGNAGNDLSLLPEYPASYDLENQITVAASDNDDNLASFSNYGGSTDLAAPGSIIRSTYPTNGYVYLSGTSMATPFVTGSLALLESQYPQAPPLELKDRILATVDPKPAFASPKTRSGGRLNLNRAVRDVRPVIPTVLSPNGGEVLPNGDQATISWAANIPAGNPSTQYRIEYSPNALASTGLTFDFQSGMPSGFSEPVDSELPWTTSATTPHPGGAGTFSARSGPIGDDQASWLSTTRRLSVAGTISFWYRISSENCESPQAPVCGDYFRFYIDGAPFVDRAGVVDWTQASFPLQPGTHTFSWSYQKDALCPGPQPECSDVGSVEDDAWVDDVSITGIDNASWSFIATTSSGATNFSWTVPGTSTSTAKVRVCQESGSTCEPSVSDDSDEVFTIGRMMFSESGGSTNVSEGVGSDTYSVVLLSQPAANVTVSLSPDSQVTVTPTSLLFTPSNWSTPQVVTIGAIDDLIDEPSPHLGLITHTASSSDANFNGFVRTLSVNITDNDTEYWFSWYDGTHGTPDWILAANPGGGSAPMRIQIAAPAVGSPVDVSFSLGANSADPRQFPGVMGGPVQVVMTDPGIVSIRSLWGSGADENFEEVAGIPLSSVSTTHYWPWYDGVSTNGQNWIHVVNPGNVASTVSLKIGGTTVKSNQVIAAGANWNYNDATKIGGPVVVTSDQPVLASQRVLWGGINFSETPSMQLTNDAFFSWYDYPGSDGRDWIVIGNAGATAVTATIAIGGTTDTVPVPANSAEFRTYPGVQNGPVRVRATGGSVVVSQRAIWGGWSMEEVGGTAPVSQGTFTFYDSYSTGGREWILVANVGASPATVTIKIAGVQQGDPITLTPNQIVTPTFANVQNGPVEVIGSGGSSLIISRRTLWGPRLDFTELLPF